MVDSITYFQLNKNTINDVDIKIMKILCREDYFRDFFKAYDNAQELRSQSKQFFYKYFPLNNDLNAKLYDQNDIQNLIMISKFIKNPHKYNFNLPLTVGDKILLIDDTDKDFVILCKAKQFYENIFNHVQKALDYRRNGKEYFVSVYTPDWFEEQYSKTMDGERFIQLWKNREIVKKIEI